MIQTADQLINALRLVRTSLQGGAVSPEVMPKMGGKIEHSLKLRAC